MRHEYIPYQYAHYGSVSPMHSPESSYVRDLKYVVVSPATDDSASEIIGEVHADPYSATSFYRSNSGENFTANIGVQSEATGHTSHYSYTRSAENIRFLHDDRDTHNSIVPTYDRQSGKLTALAISISIDDGYIHLIKFDQNAPYEALFHRMGTPEETPEGLMMGKGVDDYFVAYDQDNWDCHLAGMYDVNLAEQVDHLVCEIKDRGKEAVRHSFMVKSGVSPDELMNIESVVIVGEYPDFDMLRSFVIANTDFVN